GSVSAHTGATGRERWHTHTGVAYRIPAGSDRGLRNPVGGNSTCARRVPLHCVPHSRCRPCVPSPTQIRPHDVWIFVQGDPRLTLQCGAWTAPLAQDVYEFGRSGKAAFHLFRPCEGYLVTV